MSAFIRTTCFATLALGALCFGRTSADPIVNDYTGTMDYSETLTISGQKKPATDHQQQWDMWFSDPNTMAVQGFDGTWKKKGGKYRSDSSDSFQDVIRIQLGDPNAKGSLKMKGIVLHEDSSLTGKVKEKFKGNESGTVVKTKRVGTIIDTVLP